VSEPNILDSVGRSDRQDPAFIDFDLTAARSQLAVEIPMSTVLVIDPIGYDSRYVTSSSLYAGILLVQPQRSSADPVRLEPGVNFKMPPTARIYISNAAQSGRMARLYCLPRAYDLKFYQRYDAPFVSPASGFAISVAVGATLISAAQAGRRSIMIRNNDAAATLYLGPTSGVTTVNGMPLSPAQTVVFSDSTTAWYGAASVGTIDTRVITEG
jgi:hypothetical protein